ncbi:MAG: cobalamin-binding protein [Magnetococcales bacterium]|nr:cobalamin-binding protein [Magnetococcales bacterium]
MKEFGKRLVGWLSALVLLLPAFSAAPVAAEGIVVQDVRGRTVRIDKPAQRIVSLSPHATEMLFAAQAGSRIVGTVDFSNHPPAARSIVRVGGYHQLDLEKIYGLKPDLIIAWAGGNARHEVQSLMDLHIPVFVSEPHRVMDILTEIEKISQLTGTRERTGPVLDQLARRWSDLKKEPDRHRPIRVFYQLWNAPMMTVNRQHIISDLIRQCGGENIFSELPALIPKIGQEAVIEADPDVIIASGMSQERPEWLDQWRQWSALQAVRSKQLFFIPPDLIQRHSPRILEGAQILCDLLEQVRRKRAAVQSGNGDSG